MSAYDKTWTAKSGDYEWEVYAFNNNSWNNSWPQIKAGSTKNESKPYISTNIDFAVKNIVVTFDTFSNDCTSCSLIVASDEKFENVVETLSPTASAGDITYSITTPAKNLYYKLSMVCSKTSKNGTAVVISKVICNPVN